jgi:uncharacterized protein (TIGR03435 family)
MAGDCTFRKRRASQVQMKLVFAILALGVCYAQTLQFEAAAIKLSAPRAPGTGPGRRGCFGGPGSQDPIRYQCTNASVSLMVVTAYEVKGFQIRPPVADDTVLYDVTAKVPVGATAAQVKEMLRNVLTERFKLAFHRETVERLGFALVVAKGGLKMKEWAPNDSPMPMKPVTDADGFTYLPRRNGWAVGSANGLTRYVGNNVGLDIIAGLANSLTGRPAIDATGLKGNYDFVLTFAPENAPPEVDGVNVFAAFERQLGLKLDSRKIPVEEFVIDHVEKSPVEN